MISIEQLDGLRANKWKEARIIDMNAVRHIHHEKFKNNQNTAGDFRVLNIKFQGMRVNPPEWETIPYHMMSFCDWYNTCSKGLHPIYFAAMAYFKLYYIQPFEYGNDYACKKLMDIALEDNGYPPFKINNEREFFTELNMAIDYSDIWGFVDYVTIEMIKND